MISSLISSHVLYTSIIIHTFHILLYSVAVYIIKKSSCVNSQFFEKTDHGKSTIENPKHLWKFILHRSPFRCIRTMWKQQANPNLSAIFTASLFGSTTKDNIQIHSSDCRMISSVWSSDDHLRAISRQIPQTSITKMILKLLIWNFIQISQGPTS